MKIRKEACPYFWVTDESKFKETQLPPIEAFASELDKFKPVDQNDYDFALKNMGNHRM